MNRQHVAISPAESCPRERGHGTRKRGHGTRLGTVPVFAQRERDHPLRRSRVVVVLLGAILLAGCGKELPTKYGQRRGPGADRSVNGTAVLADMMARAGHDVSSWHRLSPRLQQRADCIVWFPDDFAPPSPQVRQWLDDWLVARSGRTLIYVGRDFDAARWYWETIRPDVPAEQKEAFSRLLNEARADYASRRQAAAKPADCGWFSVDGRQPRRKVTTLSGDPEWLAGIDPAELEMELESRLVPAEWADVLLESEGDVLVSRETVLESQRIVVANGSFLLNLPLVNHEHRKLAGKLIDAIGPPRQTVVFLESEAGGPTVSETETPPAARTGLEIFALWPTNWILPHLVAVGILFCAWRFPIFGLARQPRPEGVADFGRHLDAMARLLRHSGDLDYAQARLAHYRQAVAAPLARLRDRPTVLRGARSPSNTAPPVPDL